MLIVIAELCLLGRAVDLLIYFADHHNMKMVTEGAHTQGHVRVHPDEWHDQCRVKDCTYLTCLLISNGKMSKIYLKNMVG